MVFLRNVSNNSMNAGRSMWLLNDSILRITAGASWCCWIQDVGLVPEFLKLPCIFNSF
jgi:hypothetical protein